MFFVAVALTLALVTGNVLVSRWSFDVLGGHARRLAAGGVIAWGITPPDSTRRS